MDNKPSFDRSLFIPIFIGFFSVLGICLVLFAARLSAARGRVQNNATATPQKYQYLATEPGVVFPTDVPTPTELATATDVPTPFIPSTAIDFSTTTPFTFVSPTLSSPAATSIFVKLTNTPSPTPTTQFLNVTYDDADFKFLYTGSWVSQTSVTGAYQNTLHVSTAIGDSVQLSFVGQKIHLAYQAGPSLGVIAVKLDGSDFALDQNYPTTTVGSWDSPPFVLSSHLITITHVSGGSVNIDSIAVLEVPTPTPTVTATATQ